MVTVLGTMLLGKSCEKYVESRFSLRDQREKDACGTQILLEKGWWDLQRDKWTTDTITELLPSSHQ